MITITDKTIFCQKYHFKGEVQSAWWLDHIQLEAQKRLNDRHYKMVYALKRQTVYRSVKHAASNCRFTNRTARQPNTTIKQTQRTKPNRAISSRYAGQVSQ